MKANYSLFENQKPDLKAFLLQVSSALSSSSASSSSSSSLSLSSNSRSPSPAEHALILENATTLLSSPVAAVSEDAKQLVLSVLYDLVDARIMNQTAEYVVWRQSGAVPSGGAGAGVGAESIKGDIAPSIRFSKAFADFTDVVQKLSQSKKGSLLTFAAERMYRSIQENKFFPTSVLLTFEQLTAVHLPRKFLTNTALSSVSHSSNKLIFNGSDGNYTFCLDHPLLKSGLYKMIIVVNRNSASALWGSPGLTTKTFSGSYGNSLLEEGAGSCCLNNDSLYCGGSTVASYTSFSRSGGRVTLAVELDASRHVAYYSADTKQVPYCVVDIPVDARFAISGYYKGTSIELQSLTKLRAPTTITLEYKPLIWK